MAKTIYINGCVCGDRRSYYLIVGDGHDATTIKDFSFTGETEEEMWERLPERVRNAIEYAKKILHLYPGYRISVSKYHLEMAA